MNMHHLAALAAAAIATSLATAAEPVTIGASQDNTIYEEDEALSNGEGDHFFAGRFP